MLRALATSMEVLKTGSRPVITKGMRIHLPFSLRGGRQYDWEEDFPINSQAGRPDGVSIFNLEFRLRGDEDRLFSIRCRIDGNLNGTASQISSLNSHAITVALTVQKRGPGGKKLSAKASLIANFIAQRIEFEYIPAIRTSGSSERIVNSLVGRELASLEEFPCGSRRRWRK